LLPSTPPSTPSPSTTLFRSTDYSFLYDQQTTYIAYFTNDAGALIDPSQHIEGRDHYRKFSNELRIATPKDYPLRFVLGRGDAQLDRKSTRLNSSHLGISYAV